MQYSIKLTPDDNGTVMVTCSALPEVSTFGEDRDDALVQAVRAIEKQSRRASRATKMFGAGPAQAAGQHHRYPPDNDRARIQLYRALREKASQSGTDAPAENGIRDPSTGCSGSITRLASIRSKRRLLRLIDRSRCGSWHRPGPKSRNARQICRASLNLRRGSDARAARRVCPGRLLLVIVEHEPRPDTQQDRDDTGGNEALHDSPLPYSAGAAPGRTCPAGALRPCSCSSQRR